MEQSIIDKFIDESNKRQRAMNEISNGIKGVELLFKRGGWPTVKIHFHFGSLYWCKDNKRLMGELFDEDIKRPLLEIPIKHREFFHSHLPKLIELAMKEESDFHMIDELN